MDKKRHVGPVTTGATAGTGLAGSAAVLIVWMLSTAGVEMPNEVSAALAVLLGGVGTLIGGYLIRPRKPGDHEA